MKRKKRRVIKIPINNSLIALHIGFGIICLVIAIDYFRQEFLVKRRKRMINIRVEIDLVDVKRVGEFKKGGRYCFIVDPKTPPEILKEVKEKFKDMFPGIHMVISNRDIIDMNDKVREAIIKYCPGMSLIHDSNCDCVGCKLIRELKL